MTCRVGNGRPPPKRIHPLPRHPPELHPTPSRPPRPRELLLRLPILPSTRLPRNPFLSLDRDTFPTRRYQERLQHHRRTVTVVPRQHPRQTKYQTHFPRGMPPHPRHRTDSSHWIERIGIDRFAGGRSQTRCQHRLLRRGFLIEEDAALGTRGRGRAVTRRRAIIVEW